MRIVHRHWVRGFLGGLLLGLGLALASIIYGVTPIGAFSPWGAIALGVLIGLLVALLPAIRGGRTKPPAYVDYGPTRFPTR
jgi:hypothetical protein